MGGNLEEMFVKFLMVSRFKPRNMRTRIRNTKKIKLVCNNRQYCIIMKSYDVYCQVCNKRCGIFDAFCGNPSLKKNRNWKTYRKNQWK